jgi:hypothetical protein
MILIHSLTNCQIISNHLIVEKGTDVDSWTMEELMDVVEEFKSNQVDP